MKRQATAQTSPRQCVACGRARVRNPFARAQEFARDTRGNVALITAFAFPVMLGAGALAIDASNLYVVKNELQSAADAGALAGAMKLGELGKPDPSYKEACDEALAYAKKNMSEYADDDGRFLTVELGTWDRDRTEPFDPIDDCAFQSGTAVTISSDDPTPDAVRVLTKRTEDAGNAVKLTLAVVFDRQFADVRASATAARANTKFENICMLALNGDLRLSGNDLIDAPGCGIASNQTLRIDGNARDGNIASAIYNNFDGNGGDDPEDFFNFTDGGTGAQTLNGSTIKNPYEGQDSEQLEQACNSDAGDDDGPPGKSGDNGGGGNKVCTLDPGLYKVDGKFDEKGNMQYRRSDKEGDGSGIVKIWATGEIDIGGTVDFEGCFNFVGASARLHGNPGFECDKEKPDPVEVKNGGVSLVQ